MKTPLFGSKEPCKLDILTGPVIANVLCQIQDKDSLFYFCPMMCSSCTFRLVECPYPISPNPGADLVTSTQAHHQ